MFKEGDKVIYTSPDTPPPHLSNEQGVVTSINKFWVFVRFGEKDTPRACYKDSLRLKDSTC